MKRRANRLPLLTAGCPFVLMCADLAVLVRPLLGILCQIPREAAVSREKTPKSTFLS